MTETLLRANRRVAGMLCVLSVICCVPGLAFIGSSRDWLLWRIGGATLLLFGVSLLVVGLWISLRPRLAIAKDQLLVYLKAGAPFRVPLEIVEVFFIGQGAVAGNDPGHPQGYKGAVAANVIVRLAEPAVDWHRRDVNLAFGVWRDGYITVRGLWCENIDAEVVKRMNHRLVKLKRELREQG